MLGIICISSVHIILIHWKQDVCLKKGSKNDSQMQLFIG